MSLLGGCWGEGCESRVALAWAPPVLLCGLLGRYRGSSAWALRRCLDSTKDLASPQQCRSCMGGAPAAQARCEALMGQQGPVPGGLSQSQSLRVLHSSLGTPALPCLVWAAGPCLPVRTLTASAAQDRGCAQSRWLSRSSEQPSKAAKGLADSRVHVCTCWSHAQQSVLAQGSGPACPITSLSSWSMGCLAEGFRLLQAEDWLADTPCGRAAAPARLPERPGLQVLPQHPGA